MKKLLCMILALVMVLALTGTAFAADKKPILVFGTSADYAPYEFMYPDESGKMVYGGIDISVAQYIADYLNMDLQIENMDFGYLLTALNKGDFDMVLADIEATEQRMGAVDFSDPYMEELPNMFLVRAADADLYPDINSFAGKNVGAQVGSTKVDHVNEDCTGANCVVLALVTDMVNELVNGKLDAILLDGAVALNYASINPDLAIAAAIVSSAKNQPIRADAVLIGEVGLSGELRGASKISARLKEAAKLGFTLAVIPRVSQKTRETFPKNMEVIEARSLREALKAVLLKSEE